MATVSAGELFGYKAPSTGNTVEIPILLTLTATGAWATGIAWNAAGMTVKYCKPGDSTYSDFPNTFDTNNWREVGYGEYRIIIRQSDAGELALMDTEGHLSFYVVCSTTSGNFAKVKVNVADSARDDTWTDARAAYLDIINKMIALTGTASAGAATSITLTGGSAISNTYRRLAVYIVSGTGAGQTRRISSYDGSTKIATIGEAWATNPAADSVFVVWTLDSGIVVGADGGATISVGTGTGQLQITSGVVQANMMQILSAAITGTAAQIVAAFTKWFNVATPTGTVNSIPDAVAGATNGLALVGSKTDLVDNPNATGLGVLTLAVWTRLTSTLATPGSIGKLVVDNLNGTITGIPAAVWAVLTSTLTGAGSAGKLLVDNLNATITSRLAPTVAARTLDVSATGEAGVDWGNVGSPTTAVVLSSTKIDLVDAPNTTAVSAIVTAIWSALTSALTVVNSIGKLLTDDIDAKITSRLAPTVAARTLDVSATGEAGVDWANVGSPTTTVNLSNTNIKTDQGVGSVSGDVGGKVLGGGASTITGTGVRAVDGSGNAIAPASVFTGITSLANWLRLVLRKSVGDATAKTELGGTYDETTDSQEALRDRGDTAWITATGFSVPGSKMDIVDAPNATGLGVVAMAVWNTLTAALTTPSTIGKLFTDDIDAKISSRLKPTVAGRDLDVSETGEAGIDWANIGSPTTAVNLSATNIDEDQRIASVVDLTQTGIADAVWNETATGHTDAGKAGAVLWTTIPAISAIFTGITSLLNHLRLITRKSAGDATAKTELGGTYNETTDSLEAISESVDAIDTGAGVYTITVTVETDEGEVFEGVRVSLDNAAGSMATPAVGFTDSSGVVEFNADAGTRRAIAAANGAQLGGYTDVTIDGNETVTIVVQAVALPVVDPGDYCTVYCDAETQSGANAIGTFSVSGLRIPANRDGDGVYVTIVDGPETKNLVDGYASVRVLQGAVVNFTLVTGARRYEQTAVVIPDSIGPVDWLSLIPYSS